MLLVVVAVALLSLSSISLRASGLEQASAQARANARLALMLAMGELQGSAGPDTRITARADILADRNPPVLGVWRSWEGSDHDPNTGLPLAPNYAAKKTNSDGSGGGGRFLKWLVSGDPSKRNAIGDIPDTAAGGKRVTLVGKNTLGADSGRAKLQIHLDPVPINANRGKGSYAWWVAGENQKARLPRPDSASRNKAQWVNAQKSDATANPGVFGMDSLRTDPDQAEKAISLRQSDLIRQSGTGSDVASKKHFYDLSVVSKGLLTNTATGGWRKDLSLFSEKFKEVPSSGLPLFRLTPRKDDSRGRASSSQPLAAGSLFYPWSAYQNSTVAPVKTYAASASWANLVDHALMYRKFGNQSAFRLVSTPIQKFGNSYDYLHTVKPMPVVARVQWVYAYTRTDTGQNPPQYRLTVMMNPVVTLWNPYNVSLDVGRMVFSLSRQSTMPVAIKYEVAYKDGTIVKSRNGDYVSLTAHGSYSGLSGDPEFYVSKVGLMPPGGTKVFGVIGGSGKGTVNGDQPNQNALISYSLVCGEGYTPGAGHFIQIENAETGVQIYSPRNRGGGTGQEIQSIKTWVKLNNASTVSPLTGQCGIKLVVREDGGGVRQTSAGGRNDGIDAKEVIYQVLQPKELADSREIALPEVTWAQILANNYSFPFMSLAFGIRAMDNLSRPGDDHVQNRLTKGFLQTSPMASLSEMGLNPGTNSRVNAAYDYNLIVHTANDPAVPAKSVGTNGYILTGLTIGTGLNRCIAAELPVKPLASLAELQGWDLRAGNPSPPFSWNIVGNSDASPLIPSSAVRLGGGSPADTQFDDSYCANHLLFDDWFVSSIAAPQPDQFGGGGSLKSGFTDFVKGTTPLVNRAYRPIPADEARASQSGGADKLFDAHVNTTSGWQNFASRLEVEGMFNVNSTSVEAWRALLGHARGHQVPYYQSSGDVALDGETDNPVLKYSIAGEMRADSDSIGQSDNGRPNTTQYTGYRVLTDKQVDELAERIVEQVRKRGPFLSLSEFVNRQLSNDKDLAMAGAIQTALNQLEGSLHGGIDAPGSNADANTRGYQFAEAGQGSSAYGMPGWVRQADLLRPLAPVLSARDDTFTIRAYGDSRDASGQVLATACCEAVVTRTRDYCDPSEAADLAAPSKSTVNNLFGRRFECVSFRWLSKSEI